MITASRAPGLRNPSFRPPGPASSSATLAASSPCSFPLPHTPTNAFWVKSATRVGDEATKIRGGDVPVVLWTRCEGSPVLDGAAFTETSAPCGYGVEAG